MAVMLSSVRILVADQLAAVIKNKVDKVLIIDSRSFLEFNTCHILNAVNVCCSKIVKRRLQQDKVSVKEFLAHTCQIDADESFDIIVYDQASVNVMSLPVDSFIYVLLLKLADVFKSVSLLRGGFLDFQAFHPCLCEDKTRKCVPLTSLSQPCLPIGNTGPTRILPFLYLGSQNDALNKELLQDHNITYELNVSTSCPRPEFILEGHFMRIPVNDNYSEKLLPHFPEAFHFLDKVQEANACVLVHCLAGISRSPTVAIAYIMQHLRLTSDEAYRYVKSKRATISPNFNFLGQLLEFERQLQANNMLMTKDIATMTAPVFANSSKRQCRTDMRSTSRLVLNLPVTTLDASLCSDGSKEFATTMPRSWPGDQSPTTGIAKLSFHTPSEVLKEEDCATLESVSSSVLKTDDHQEQLCQSRCLSKARFSSTMALQKETCSSSSSTTTTESNVSISERSSSFVFSSSSSSCSHETKRFITSKVQIHKNVGSSIKVDPKGSWPVRSSINFTVDNATGISSQEESTPEREVSVGCMPLMEKSRDSLTDSVDSLTRSSSSVCSSWAADIPEYCRSDSTSTSGLGSEMSDLESLTDGQNTACVPLSPKREIIIDNEGVLLRKPCFLLPGCSAPVRQLGAGNEQSSAKARDSGNPLSPTKRLSAEDDEKSRQMFGFWEKASTKGNVEASHDSGIVTSPLWTAEGGDMTVKWLPQESEPSSDVGERDLEVLQRSTWHDVKAPTIGVLGKRAGMERFVSTNTKSEASKHEKKMESKTITTTDAWRSLVAKHVLGTVFTGKDQTGLPPPPTTTTAAAAVDGLYRAHSCPGIMSWLQCASSSPTASPNASRGRTFTAASSLGPPDPRLRKLNLSSSIGQSERFRNRYSCGSLDCADIERFVFDSCPDLGHFRQCHSSTKSLESDEMACLSPSHRTFNRSARVIQVS